MRPPTKVHYVAVAVLHTYVSARCVLKLLKEASQIKSFES